LKSPAFQFYPADFLADAKVAVMTDEQIGIYIRLMCHCWLEGFIPSDLEKVSRICRRSREDMERLWPEIRECFREDADDPIKLLHPRLEKERCKQQEHKKQKTIAGKAGAAKRWAEDSTAILSPSSENGSAMILPMAKNSSSSSLSSSSSPSISSSEDKKINIFSSDAEEMRLSQLLFELIQKRNPKHKPPNFQQWAREIDLMLRQDHRVSGEIEKVIRWSQADSFWQNNILSTSKLREKFDQIWLKINSKPQEKGNSYDPARFRIGTDFADKDYRQGVF